jgi:D-arabinose 1-dehydrogenase-like Zn-dependent alcohol dehydrogenase
VHKTKAYSAASAHEVVISRIPIQKVNEACDRMARSDVKYRFSIDMASLEAE